jgi:hypothetical protein
MNFRRSALIVIVVLASVGLAEPWSRGATLQAPIGLPIFQFVNSGSGPLPWNAFSLENAINNTTMLGGPHAASSATQGVVAYRTNHGDLAMYTQHLNGPAHWTDLSRTNNVPTPAADPVPFFDPDGNVDLLYIDSGGDAILLSKNDSVSPLWHHLRGDSAWRPYLATDLSALSGVRASNGLASIQVTGLNATIAYRTASNGIEILQMGWASPSPVPFLTSTPGGVSGTAITPTIPTTTTTVKPTTTTTLPSGTTTTRPTGTTTTTTLPSGTTTTRPTGTTTTTRPGATTTTSPTGTTTTKPVATTTTTIKATTTTTTTPITSPTAIASDPIVLPGAVPAFATTTNRGDLVIYTNSGTSLASWSTVDLTTLTLTPKVAGTLAMGASANTVDIAALTTSGAVELFSSPLFTSVTGHVANASPWLWNVTNVTNNASGAPPLSGSIFVAVTPTQISIAGQASNWGDLFDLTNAVGTSTWSATDVSVTAGRSARTVGGVVAGLVSSSTLTLFAAGVNSPPPQGVGVYAIPSTKWGQAIADGWPIISETGGLGTQSSPWVGFTNTKNVALSPDFLIGQSIYNSHKRVTWLSFWTASGRLANEPQTAASFYSHGFTSGAWVAAQIDQYRSLGVGLKPDWVIFDPEGYPDNHSGLDAPGGSSGATIARYATYWAAMMNGWSAGITSVDPSLNAGVYASQSEYRNYGLTTQALPVFVAVAFGGGGPVPVAGASGSNIRGFISFSATCSPKSQLKAEEQTLLNPPWAGQFNTLQFNAGVYCAPH